MSFNHKLIISLSLLFTVFTSNSQILKHEVGGFVGPTMFQGDYGQRSSYGTSLANVGFAIGGVYYISFDEGRGRWYDRSDYKKNHFRLRAELSYMSTKFKHGGDETNIKMLAMEGSTKMVNYAGQLEYAIYGHDEIDRAWKPYVAVGLTYVQYNPDLKSSLGDWRDDPSLIPAVYLNDGLFLEKNSTTAITFSGGTRYDLGNFDFIFEMKWQRFLNGEVDGIDPKLNANKYRDWMALINFGVVIPLN